VERVPSFGNIIKSKRKKKERKTARFALPPPEAGVARKRGGREKGQKTKCSSLRRRFSVGKSKSQKEKGEKEGGRGKDISFSSLPFSGRGEGKRGGHDQLRLRCENN